MAFRKRLRKVAKKVVKYAKKRYGSKGGRSRLVKDVAMLKHLVNVEKKRFDVTQSTSQAVGLLNTAGVSGAYSTTITPYPLEGVTQGARIGNSIKIVSACMDVGFAQQSATVNKIKLRWYIVCREDNGFNYTASTSLNQFLEVNPISTVNDYFSSRDPEYFSAFRVIKQGVVSLGSDTVTNSRQNAQIKVPLKLNHHLKFNTDASTTTTKNQFYLFVTASDGDIAINTGIGMTYNIRWYYTDN